MAGSLAYVIETGTIGIERRHSDDSSEGLARLGPGEYFGGASSSARSPRSATARGVVTPSVLRAYNVADFREQVVGATAGADAD